MIGIFQLELDDYRVGGNEKASRIMPIRVLETFFEAFVRVNVAFLIANKTTPLLYQSGVRYARDPETYVDGRKVEELWLDAATILKRGKDDCEGLACFLAAEMRVRAPNSVRPYRVPAACVRLKRTRHAGLLHAVVWDPASRTIFDPSKKLGMGKHEV